VAKGEGTKQTTLGAKGPNFGLQSEQSKKKHRYIITLEKLRGISLNTNITNQTSLQFLGGGKERVVLSELYLV